MNQNNQIDNTRVPRIPSESIYIPRIGQNTFNPNSRQNSIPIIEEKSIGYKNKDLVQTFLAECFGTIIFVLIGASKCTPFIFGLGLIVATQAFFHISGAHLNPAVTIAAFIVNKNFRYDKLLVYLAGQLIGAYIGYGIFYLIFHLNQSPNLSCVASANTLLFTEVKIFFVEFFLGMFYILMRCSFWDAMNDNRGDGISLKIGLTYTVLQLGGFDVSKNGMNTFFALASASYLNYWTAHWIYWFGANLGAVIGAFIYKFLLFDRPWQSKVENKIL